MKLYRKKPVTISAQQIKLTDFTSDHPNDDHIVGVRYHPVGRFVEVRALEGVMRGEIGDWIIRGVEGELYPCKDSIFQKTYEPVPS